MLESRDKRATASWVFTSEDGTRPLPIFTVDCQHARVRAALNKREDLEIVLPADFVLHSMGTRS